jgi:hypothetical protein
MNSVVYDCTKLLISLLSAKVTILLENVALSEKKKDYTPRQQNSFRIYMYPQTNAAPLALYGRLIFAKKVPEHLSNHILY